MNNRTGILVHGCHVQAEDWERIVWGEPPYQLGRIPAAVLLAIKTEARMIIFGTGASQTPEGIKEGQATLNLLKERWDNLCDFIDLEEKYQGGGWPNKENFLDICVAEIESQNTVDEVRNAGQIFADAGIDRICLVSSPTHLSRCLLNAMQVFGKTPELQHLMRGLFAHPSDTCYAGATTDDIVVLEPNHRGDIEPTSPQLNELVPRFFGLQDKQSFVEDFEALLRKHGA